MALAALAVIPGLPKLPFVLVGGGTYLLGRRLGAAAARAIPEAEAAAAAAAALEVAPPRSVDDPEEISRAMQVEPLGLELAVDLVDLVETSTGGDLLDRVKALRRKLAMELGVVIPSVRTRDNLDLPAHTYVILLHGVEVARGIAPPGQVLVIADDLATLPGPVTAEPVFGLPAKWLSANLRGQAEAMGATVVDRAAVVTTHLAEIARRHAGDLLSRQSVKALLEVVREGAPTVLDDLGALQVTTGEIQRVLHDLLEEGVAVRDLVRILESVGERARQTRDPDALVEAARSALGPAISAVYAADGRLPVVTIAPLAEQALHGALRVGEQGAFLALGPDAVQALTDGVSREVDRIRNTNVEPVLVCGAAIRRSLRRLLASALPNPPAVIGYTEIGGHLQVQTLGTVSIDEPVPV
jgi:flagellar biosynthesis protein FlhA